MSLVKIKVDIKKAEKYLKGMPAKEKTAIDRALSQAVLFLEGEVKQSLSGNRAEHKRVDTGRLRGSVKGVVPKRGVGVVATNVKYGKFIEYGTSKLKAGRHFRNSIARNRQKVIEYIRKAVKKVK